MSARKDPILEIKRTRDLLRKDRTGGSGINEKKAETVDTASAFSSIQMSAAPKLQKNRGKQHRACPGVVETKGIEPSTLRMRTVRSPS